MRLSLRDLSLKPAYETLKEDPVREFYVPALREAVGYDRIAGFFSSTSLALAARGVLGLIENGGHMRLIVSPNLSADDLEAIRRSTADPQAYIESAMIRDLDDLGETLRDNHVRALGWMLANGLLEMKIACVVDEDSETTGALFHQKVGILRDSDGNAVTFSGSINETASGWLSNAEEFKVFNSWTEGHSDFLHSDVTKFEEFWNGERAYAQIFSPSEAFEAHIMRLGEGFKRETVKLKEYVKERKREEAVDSIPLFPYQADAVEKWERCGRRMLFEMATGTGKTRTAIACANIAKATEKRFVCIVAAPEVTLARQWEGEFDALGVTFDQVVFADGSSGGRKAWEPNIKRSLSRIRSGMDTTLLVMVTHATACKEAFTELFAALSSSVKICFIGDEVHGLGARKQRYALIERYDYRIGLSATPSRWFDEEGTAIVMGYFNDSVFEFSIRDAQRTIRPGTNHAFLTPYVYTPIYVCLDDEEMEQYIQLTERISKLSHSDDDDTKDLVERLMMKRADITKNAASKMGAFCDLVEREEYVDKTLIFTSPQQIEETLRLLAERKISAHPFTQAQGTRKLAEFGGKSEREYLIEQFKQGGYQALVAISCLDEGIDIPAADTAILLSNSTNPREYIQRIGRVIRYYEGKEEAYIYDFVVEPDWSRIHDPEVLAFETRLFEKELRRVAEMADNAINSVEVLQQTNKRLEVLYGI